MKIEKLKTYEYIDRKTKWTSNEKKIPWKKKFEQLSVWFLVWQDYSHSFNVYVNQVKNDDNLTLREWLKEIHADFLNEKNQYFRRHEKLTYKKIEARKIISIHEEPLRRKK